MESFVVLLFVSCILLNSIHFCHSNCTTNRYSGLVQVDCSSINFADSAPVADVTHLMINCIKSIPMGNVSFLSHFPDLIFLSISQCPISSMPINMFHNLTKLKVMHLNRLNIKALHSNMFQNSTNIEQLHLIDLENLTYISPYTFSEDHKIKEISLIKLRIQAKNLWTFLTMSYTTLEVLTWINSYEKIIFNIIYFSHFRLKNLKVVGNKIDNVHFLSNTRTEKINLDDNNLGNGNIFISNSTKEIKLGYNNIEGEFPRHFLGSATSVRSLGIDNNRITGFRKDFSLLFPKLENLDARFNRILRITNDLQPLFASVFINLLGNPIFCDCKMNDIISNISQTISHVKCNIAIVDNNDKVRVSKTAVNIRNVSTLVCLAPRTSMWIAMRGAMIDISNNGNTKEIPIIPLYKCEYLQLRCLGVGDPLPELEIINPDKPMVTRTMLRNIDPITVSTPLLTITYSGLSDLPKNNYLKCTGINYFGKTVQTVIFQKMSGYRPLNVYRKGVMMTYLCDRNEAVRLCHSDVLISFLTFVYLWRFIFLEIKF